MPPPISEPASALRQAARLVADTLAAPEELAVPQRKPGGPLSQSFRNAAAHLYAAAKSLHGGDGAAQLYTGPAFDTEQIAAQMKRYTDGFLAAAEKRVATLESAKAAPAQAVGEMSDSEEDAGPARAEAPVGSKRRRDTLGKLEQKLKRKRESRMEELELKRLEEAYRPAKAEKEEDEGGFGAGAGGDAELEDELDAMDLDGEESEEDEPDAPPIGTAAAAKRMATGTKRHTTAVLPREEDEEEGEEEEDEEEGEESSIDEEMLAEQMEDEAAMREMYGIGNFEPGEKMDDEDLAEAGAQVNKSRKRPRAEHKEEGGAEDGAAEDADDGSSSEVIFDGDERAGADDDGDGLTPFERRQKDMLRKIQKIEDERVAEKHWTLRGETQANQREQNELLNEVLEYDTTSRPRPLITAESTAALEERIKSRIRDARFDDVERKEKKSSAADLMYENKHEVDLHAKSKVGLADLYEKEWLEKHRKELEDAGATTKELTEEEKEELKVIRMWKVLSADLDALSNFYYTPTAAASDELQIRASQQSAIALEEVTPAAVTNAQQLAPQDVKAGTARKYADKEDTELTTSDKKRLRRARKEAHQRKEKRITVQKAKRAAAGKKDDSERKNTISGKVPRHVLARERKNKAIAGKK